MPTASWSRGFEAGGTVHTPRPTMCHQAKCATHQQPRHHPLTDRTPAEDTRLPVFGLLRHRSIAVRVSTAPFHTRHGQPWPFRAGESSDSYRVPWLLPLPRECNLKPGPRPGRAHDSHASPVLSLARLWRPPPRREEVAMPRRKPSNHGLCQRALLLYGHAPHQPCHRDRRARALFAGTPPGFETARSEACSSRYERQRSALGACPPAMTRAAPHHWENAP